MSENNRKKEEDTKDSVNDKKFPPTPPGFEGIFKGLNSLVNYLDDLADKAERLGARTTDPDAGQESPPPRRRGGFTNSMDLNFRTASTRSVQPYQRPTAPQPRSTPLPPDAPGERREPIVDIFDEDADGIILLIVELPGVNEKTIKVEIEGDIVHLKADSATYRFEKECLLPAHVNTEAISRRYQNGVLELRLKCVSK
jgi:HSP20 family molecular chaperone IbpA